MKRAALSLLLVAACGPSGAPEAPSPAAPDASSPTAPGPAATAAPGRRRVAVVVLDGFGLGLAKGAPLPQPNYDAIRTVLDRRPEGFLARAIDGGQWPLLRLGASGPCVGLPEGKEGNSEAGHGAICAGGPVEQRRTMIDKRIERGELAEAPGLRVAFAQAQKPNTRLHVVFNATDSSSSGHFAHAAAVLELAHQAGVRDLQLHALCDESSERSCPELLRDLVQTATRLGIGSFASIAGGAMCGSAGRPTECVAGLRRQRGTAAPQRLGAVLQLLAGDPKLADRMSLVPIAGGSAVEDGDVVLILGYRRDVAQELVRGLRRRDEGVPPSPYGPLVVTMGLLDARSRYDDDPLLEEAFAVEEPPALFHERLAAAGVRQLRVAEAYKSAHVTYFCDRESVEDGPLYRRYHPESLSKDAIATQPCLATPGSVDHALEQMRAGAVDFVLMNLPNADRFGHNGDFDAAVAGISCLDEHLGRFVDGATALGWDVLVTGDHGNADIMRNDDGTPHMNHTRNPVPLIAIAGQGHAPLRLRQDVPDACVGAVGWTALDLMGLANGDPRSLLAPGGRHRWQALDALPIDSVSVDARRSTVYFRQRVRPGNPGPKGESMR